ncbi:hypothetical protein ACFSJ3_03230 [Corallincola platygyrae]|uniref:Uncharacterized protein n=1 Tax=Corallincola platygyrae TaxID=1193278 RepID=A0ABW4XHG7_9GAMM
MNKTYLMAIGGLGFVIGVSVIGLSAAVDDSTHSGLPKKQAMEDDPFIERVNGLPGSANTDIAQRSEKVKGNLELAGPPPNDGSPDKATIIWSQTGGIPAQYADLENQTVDRRFIEFQTDTFVHAAIGDVFDVTIPQTAAVLETKVSSIKMHANGDRTIVGEYTAEDGQQYAITFTQGANALFAHIGTPTDTYFMEGHNNQGWVLSGRDQSSLKTWEHTDAVTIPAIKHVTPPQG